MTEFLKRYYRRNNRPINFNEVQEVAIVERAASGRILKMTITTDAGVIEVPNDEIRNAFYPPISTFFYIEPIYKEDGDERVLDGYTFVGGGFGHGVGSVKPAPTISPISAGLVLKSWNFTIPALSYSL